ncbi:MAG: hypothetical protein M0C28_16735 [Candidatus Moduliflexus flocculans]|nr:hypothetical protein [Candidatus Moduliflexus flocculans]
MSIAGRSLDQPHFSLIQGPLIGPICPGLVAGLKQQIARALGVLGTQGIERGLDDIARHAARVGGLADGDEAIGGIEEVGDRLATLTRVHLAIEFQRPPVALVLE